MTTYGPCRTCGDVELLDASGRCSSCVGVGVEDPAECEWDDGDDDGSEENLVPA